MKSKENSKKLSILAFLFGLAGVLLMCTPIGILSAVVSFVLSIVCLAKKREGKRLAITGLIISISIISMSVKSNQERRYHGAVSMSGMLSQRL